MIINALLIFSIILALCVIIAIVTIEIAKSITDENRSNQRKVDCKRKHFRGAEFIREKEIKRLFP